MKTISLSLSLFYFSLHANLQMLRNLVEMRMKNEGMEYSVVKIVATVHGNINIYVRI